MKTEDTGIKNKIARDEEVQNFELKPPEHNAPNNPIPPPPQQVDSNTKVIKEGEISFATKNINISSQKIKKVVSLYQGYISNDNLQITGERIQNNLTIRIPAKYLDYIVDSISCIANELDSKRISSEDITANYVDIEARMNTKKALEKRYLQLLTKAAKVSDMIQIEEQIANIREDIESAEGRLRLMKNQVSLSTLQITMYEIQQPASPLINKIKGAIISGWNGFIEFCMIFIYGWVFVIFLLIGWILYRTRKNIRK